ASASRLSPRSVLSVIFLHWGYDMTIKTLLRHANCGAQHLRSCLLISVTLGAAGCAPAPEPTHQTVEYYRTNKEARAEKFAQCENDPGALGQAPDCINARQAARQDTKSLRDLPPL